MILLPLLFIVLVLLHLWVENRELEAHKARVTKSFTDAAEDALRYMRENQ